ncbi:alpha/beta hydrolase [Clostridium aestuarii]|uniref:Alpha/beta hydrolase n=1 Tax=Clostridium aestuarii TaxID=338193 RepID=A0ABT4D2E9_9CLOT|nr:alpha/beta hydrolase [Clostridium aestuarii]MCY6485419.1 alpha/beta hydrolase [Clostridium aestuarii]
MFRKYIMVKNIKISYLEFINNNSNKLIIVGHGASMQADFLAPFAKLLNKKYNVIVVDLPAHGNSQGEVIPTLEGIAEFHEQFANALKKEEKLPEDVTFIGYSLSACAAVEIGCRNYYKNLKRLIIVSGAPKVNVDFNIIEDTKIDGKYNLSELFKGFWTSSTKEETKNFLKSFNKIRKTSDESVIIDFKSVIGWDRSEDLNLVKVPSLTVIGDQDNLTLVEDAIKLKNIPKSELAVFNNESHGLVYNKTEQVVNVIFDFMSRYCTTPIMCNSK